MTDWAFKNSFNEIWIKVYTFFMRDYCSTRPVVHAFPFRKQMVATPGSPSRRNAIIMVIVEVHYQGRVVILIKQISYFFQNTPIFWPTEKAQPLIIDCLTVSLLKEESFDGSPSNLKEFEIALDKKVYASVNCFGEWCLSYWRTTYSFLYTTAPCNFSDIAHIMFYVYSIGYEGCTAWMGNHIQRSIPRKLINYEDQWVCRILWVSGQTSQPPKHKKHNWH